MVSSSSSRNIQNFKQLTTSSSTGPSTFSSTRYIAGGGGGGFGSIDVNPYMDKNQANEHIKALLEGAFEDEADKKHDGEHRGKKKKKGKTSKKKQKKSGSHELQESRGSDGKQEENSSDDVDDLASRLQGVAVGDAEDEKHVKQKLEEKRPDGSENRDAKVPSKNEEEEEEDAEEEDEDEEDEEEDGTVEGLNVKLLPHQIEGVRWMCRKEKAIVPKGGILADDMGLGKTIQAIALILSNRFSPEKASSEVDLRMSKSTLVVAPVALVKQWESEIISRVEEANKLRVLVYHGATRVKASNPLNDYDVVVTTYGTLSAEYSNNISKSGLFSVHWCRIILDEAHTIKNRNAKASQAACALDGEYRWCMTGTPLQNGLDELQSLIKFLRVEPYMDLGSWRRDITLPLSDGRSAGRAIQRLHVFLKTLMKRRTKDVLKLDSGKSGGDDESSSGGFRITKREVVRVNADFTSREMDFYRRLEQQAGNTLDKIMGDQSSRRHYMGAMVLLLRLRQACNHPGILRSDLVEDKDVLMWNGSVKQQREDEADDVANLLGAMSIAVGGDDNADDGTYVGPGGDGDDEEEKRNPPSTKIRHLMHILSQESSTHKFIVFSSFTSMLDKIEPFLVRAGIGFARYDGSMRNDRREASLDRLRNSGSTRVLLCSLRAGALGLNLTAASRVVILEPFWNPVSVFLLPSGS